MRRHPCNLRCGIQNGLLPWFSLVPAAYVPRASDAPPMLTPPRTQFLFDTALQSDFLFWLATKLARETVIRAILATPPIVIESAGAEEQARVQQMLEHILPVSPRRPGLLNDAAVTSSLLRYELEKITASTLLISAADDLFGTSTARAIQPRTFRMHT